MYLAVALGGLFGVFKRRRLAAALMAILFVALEGLLAFGGLDWGGFGDRPLQLAICFVAGAGFYFFRYAVSWRWQWAAIGLGLALLARSTWAFYVLFLPAMVYASLWAAVRGPVFFRRINHWGDFSYGLYIFAFPIQQALIAKFSGFRNHPYSLFIVAECIALCLGWVSWRMIEKPALALKNRVTLGKVFGRLVADHSSS
jgi:peptidoglycan/LPS O-acetylase OafA/YrhL